MWARRRHLDHWPLIERISLRPLCDCCIQLITAGPCHFVLVLIHRPWTRGSCLRYCCWAPCWLFARGPATPNITVSDCIVSAPSSIIDLKCRSISQIAEKSKLVKTKGFRYQNTHIVLFKAWTTFGFVFGHIRRVSCCYILTKNCDTRARILMICVPLQLRLQRYERREQSPVRHFLSKGT